MRITLKNTPEQEALVKAMGSNNTAESREAQEAFAAFLGPVVAQVINQAATAGAVYVDAPYDADDSPSFPLDLYYNESDNYFSVISQNIAGGLPTSQDVFAGQELKIAPYRLDSAVSFLKKYARRGRLDVLAKAVERMAQEVLVKQERNAWAVILKAAADGVTNSDQHAFALGGITFQLNDLNLMMTRMRRINSSFAQGTPADGFSRGLTDLFVSPEVMEDIRGFSYNAVGGETAGATATDLPNTVRDEIYRAAGAGSLFGVNITEILELGPNRKYVNLMETLDPSLMDNPTTTDDIIVGIDASKGAFVRAIATQDNSTFTALADDQFSARSEKLGFYGHLEEGRVCVDTRAVVVGALT
jgi:hypothetical protein|uniref:hypothetical protein n=1 Tax=Flavobacterium sp. TaxID=239 RepID=UPI0040483568